MAYENVKVPYKTALHVYVHSPSESVMCRTCAAKHDSKHKYLAAPWHGMGSTCEHCGGDLFSHLKENEDGSGFVRKGQTIAKRPSVNPESGEHKYGDVEYADETNKKYPIDTKEHVRAALSYINHAENAAQYSGADIKRIKAKIYSAAERFGINVDKTVKKSFHDKQIEKGDSNLDRANAAVEGDEPGDIDGDPANNFESNGRTNRGKNGGRHGDKNQADNEDIDDDTTEGDNSRDSSGADGYGDPEDGDEAGDSFNPGDSGEGQENLNEGDEQVPVTKADEEILTIMKAEEFVDTIRGIIHDEVSNMGHLLKSEILASIPSHFAGAVSDAFQRTLAPVNNNIIAVSKTMNDLAEHLDSRFDDVDDLQTSITKSLSLAEETRVNTHGVKHEPLKKGDTLRVPATDGGTVLNPERVDATKFTLKDLEELISKAQKLQAETHTAVEGLSEVMLSKSTGSIAPVLIINLKRNVEEIQKSVAV